MISTQRFDNIVFQKPPSTNFYKEDQEDCHHTGPQDIFPCPNPPQTYGNGSFSHVHGLLHGLRILNYQKIIEIKLSSVKNLIFIQLQTEKSLLRYSGVYCMIIY